MGRVISVTTILVFAAIVAVVGLGGCDREKASADALQAQQTKQSMAEAQRQVGMPAITNFQEKRLAKLIFELRDQENLPTHAYIVNLKGELIYLGRCVGFGLPYSTQYTNPERQVRWYKQFHTLPQPDPNGLFTPTGLSATWLMMVDDKGEARPVYVEPEIIVSPFPLHKIVTKK